MGTSLHNLVPSLTGSVLTKLLFLEVYFLFKVGRSPAFFKLTDFLDGYAIEILYLTITLTLLSAWFFLPAIAAYYIIAGSIYWLLRRPFFAFTWSGVPVFKALSIQQKADRVSLGVAEDFLHHNPDADLGKRIEEYKERSQKALESEAASTANLALLVTIVALGWSGTQNFLDKICSIFDPYLLGHAYGICVFLLVSGGVLGRATGFNALRDAGSLPASFFRSDDERIRVKRWAEKMITRHETLAKKHSV